MISFATQNREASEGAMAALWSGGVNVGARGHDAGYLSLLVQGCRYVVLSLKI